MPRPLMQQDIDQLKALFASSKFNSKVLRQLEHELQFREKRRALALLEQVQAAIPAADSVPEPAANGSAPARQSDLWNQASADQQPELPPPTEQPSKKPTATGPRPTAATPHSVQFLTFDDACKILQVSPSSPWQEVELARRRLVQLSHPERISSMAPEQRSQEQADAQQVNAAYAVLSAAKVC